MESTLVYTLTSCELSFDDFYLIIRGLHSYMVKSIDPCPANKTVQVKLSYQANLSNVRTKMGSLVNHASVSKLNPNIKDDEFSKLEELRKKFNFGAPLPPQDKPRRRKQQPTARRVFGKRSKPYACSSKKAYKVPEDSQYFGPQQELEQDSSDSSENEQ